ncbi:dolichol-phosphate mannosyltransferase [Olsenella profusa DSM 13989]|uniref:glycosyltransferase family 2 protein n=1 Tax=Olsenella profusa TaxID=138595 RepID=UPI00278A5B10|nr:glycosyltransferase family 2 protein [Olsenella profusa]MDP9858634.1 dolichol-phosphate mannosyltransferase [Olsenella profusa DSM 13989]
MSDKIEVSVVVPVYGCPGAISELHRRLVNTLESMEKDFEIILVNDCDPYGSWEKIREVCVADHRVIGLNLSRNFGQIKAITAGLDRACGEWIVVMDCDLQDRPEGIIDLYKKAQEGYDVVFARRLNRKDTKLVKFFSKVFYKVYDYFTDGTFDNSICNFSISRRIVIDNYCKMREHNRAYTLFIRWLGFKQAEIDIEADARFEGESSYNFHRKVRTAFELITAQSNKPLRLATSLGFTISIVSFLYLLYLLISALIAPSSAPMGWRSTIGAIFLMGGLILAAIGVVGLYIGNIFDEVKNRPLYVVRDVLNGGREE